MMRRRPHKDEILIHMDRALRRKEDDENAVDHLDKGSLAGLKLRLSSVSPPSPFQILPGKHEKGR